MKIEVSGRKVDLEASVKTFAERRIRSGMGRFSNKIREVRVQISDVNGPKGGRDKECRVEVRLRTVGSITTKAVEVNLHAAIARAIERAGHAVSEWVKRSREFEHTPVRTISTAPPMHDLWAGDHSAALPRSDVHV